MRWSQDPLREFGSCSWLHGLTSLNEHDVRSHRTNWNSLKCFRGDGSIVSATELESARRRFRQGLATSCSTWCSSAGARISIIFLFHVSVMSLKLQEYHSCRSLIPSRKSLENQCSNAHLIATHT